MPQADPKPVKGSAKRQRARKRAAQRDPAYLRWLHGQPCLAARWGGCRGGIEAHHERSISGDDLSAGPLCEEHHRGVTGRHGRLRSLRKFEERYGIVWREETCRLRDEYVRAS